MHSDTLTPYLTPRPAQQGTFAITRNGTVEHIDWAWVFGEGDDTDCVFFRHYTSDGAVPYRLDVPAGLPWPRTKGEVVVQAMRIITRGYTKAKGGTGTIGGYPVGPALYDERSFDF